MLDTNKKARPIRGAVVKKSSSYFQLRRGVARSSQLLHQRLDFGLCAYCNFTPSLSLSRVLSSVSSFPWSIWSLVEGHLRRIVPGCVGVVGLTIFRSCQLLFLSSETCILMCAVDCYKHTQSNPDTAASAATVAATTTTVRTTTTTSITQHYQKNQ